MTKSWCFDNFLETAATPHQRFRNVSVTNIPEHSKEELQTFDNTDCTKSAKIAKKNSQSIDRR